MNWRPFNTLTGRMVLVTVAAVALSYLAAYALYANERGAALRRAAETAAIERIAFTAERLRQAPLAQRAQVARATHDYAIRYAVEPDPLVMQAAQGGAARRIARSISDRLGGAEVRVETRESVAIPRREIPPEARGRRGRDRDEHREYHEHMVRAAAASGRRLVPVTEMIVSAALGDGVWLNAKARLPGPRPAPIGLLVGALVSMIAVGVGAALVSAQIGRPLAGLTRAASALGAGQSNISAPEAGPEDVRRASAAFNAMAARLGRQLARQRHMLWALSHDLRTPITALRLRAELIEDEATRQRMLAPLDEMEKLTQQALDLARAGASEEPRAIVDVAEIVRTLCGELRDVGLDLRDQAEEPLLVECRPAEIARALRNLGENAVKYAGAGIMRTARGSEGQAIIEVLDEGPGVPADVLTRLAEPFFRADAARSQANGAGLGLAIAQAIADNHGGRLEFSNRSPRGFSAKLVLPGQG